MRLNPRALREQRFQPRTAEIGIVAPLGGWNTVSALADMPETDAVTLENWYPELGKVRIRKGYESHATGVGAGAVETLVEYNSGSIRRLLAASSTTIYNATSAGAASSIQAGFANGRWQVADLIGNQLWVNGADTPQVYNGTTFSASTITGPTVTALTGCHSHRHRMYVWESNSPSFWYGGVNAIGGAFSEFPLSRVATIGGNLVAVGTWTVDTGEGADDVIAFYMSSGQVIVYNGNDPGDAANWALAGIYKTGAVPNARSVAKVGADLRAITTEDYVPLTALLRNEPSITKARGHVLEATQSSFTAFGWQIIDYPRGGMVIHNVPHQDGSFHQDVQNKATQAWCHYDGLDANVWSLYNNDLYFGGAAGVVYKAETGNADNGNAIQADAITAWTRLEIPNQKRVAATRPILGVTGNLSYNFGIGFDFQTPTVTDPSIIVATGSPWDTSAWDVSSWSPENVVQTAWKFASGTGSHLALRLRVASKSEVNWYRTDLRIEPGTGL